MENEQEKVETQTQAKQRKARVFSSKVYLVTLVTVGNQDAGSQSYLVRGVKTEAGAKRALLEGLTVTSRLIDSGELLDMLKAGEFPPEIVASPDAADGVGDDAEELVDTGVVETKVGSATGCEDTVVPGVAFHDDQHREENHSWGHGREFA